VFIDKMVKRARVPEGFEDYFARESFVSDGGFTNSGSKDFLKKRPLCERRGYHLVGNDVDRNGNEKDNLYCQTCRKYFSRFDFPYQIKSER
jgi:hypothetical protein